MTTRYLLNKKERKIVDLVFSSLIDYLHTEGIRDLDFMKKESWLFLCLFLTTLEVSNIMCLGSSGNWPEPNINNLNQVMLF